MQAVDDNKETLYLYVVPAEPARPSVLPLIVSVIALLLVAVGGVLIPYQQPVVRAVIRTAPVPLDVRSFTTSVPITPTGLKQYPATRAHGVLTLTNGSIIAQVIPAGFTVHNVATDRAVYVPAGSANGFGYATVPAHVLVSGRQGNLPPLAINVVEGTSLYIRNVQAFSGGRDAYSVKVATAQDRQTGLLQARRILLSRSSGLHYPCVETLSGAVIVTWRCHFVSYYLPPSIHVSAVHFAGKDLILTVWYVAHPTRFWVK
jgi:hypothetical protein